jgi:hypothetical protein
MHGGDVGSDAINPEGGLERVESRVKRRRAVAAGCSGSRGSPYGFFQIGPRTYVSQNLFAEARAIVHISHAAEEKPPG